MGACINTGDASRGVGDAVRVRAWRAAAERGTGARNTVVSEGMLLRLLMSALGVSDVPVQ